MARANVGLDAEFTDLYRRERACIVGVIRRRGVLGDEAEDVAQEVFLLLHRRFPDLYRDAGLRSWLGAVAVRVCSNLRRGRHRRGQHLRRDVDLDVDRLADVWQQPSDELLAWRQERRLLARAIARLNEPEREVFVRAELEQETAAVIGAAMQVSPNTVSSRLRAARRRVARTMLELTSDAPGSAPR